MKRFIFIILSLILIISLSACNQKEEIKKEKEEIEKVEEQKEEKEVKEEKKEEEKIGELIEKELSKNDNLFNFKKEVVEKGKELSGFSPERDIQVYSYLPTEDDMITFEYSNDFLEFFKSIKIKPFSNLKINKKITTFEWEGMYQDPINLKNASKIIQSEIFVNGDNFYEKKMSEDKLNIKTIYHYEDDPLYYIKRSEAYEGDVDDKGNLNYYDSYDVINYLPIKSFAPSMDQSVIKDFEEIKFIGITSIDNKPIIYLEKSDQVNFIKNWIDIKTGLCIKEEIYDENGLIIEESHIEEVREEEFNIPLDEKFKTEALADYTMHMMENYTKVDGFGFIDLLSRSLSRSNALKLTSDQKEYKLYYKEAIGYEFDFSLLESICIYKDEENNQIRELSLYDVYLVDDMNRTYKVYDANTVEKKFFTFNNTIFLGYKDENNTREYSFYDRYEDPNTKLHKVYSYVVETVDEYNKELKSIKMYSVKGIDKEKIGEVETFTIDYIERDDMAYDQSFMEDYKMIDCRVSNEGDFTEKDVSVDDNMVLSFDKNIVELMPKIGGISPKRDMITYTYIPTKEDAVQFTNSDNPKELFDSIRVNPYPNFKITKKAEHYMWFSYDEMAQNMGTSSDIEIIFKNGDIYKNQTYYMKGSNISYYNSSTGLLYEIEKTEDELELDDNGNPMFYENYDITNYNIIKDRVPTINPVVLKDDEKLRFAAITEYKEKPVIYLEIIGTEKFRKEWIDIKTGVSLRTEIYFDDGAIDEAFEVTDIRMGDFNFEDIKEFENKIYCDDTLYQFPEDMISDFLSAIRAFTETTYFEETNPCGSCKLVGDSTYYMYCKSGVSKWINPSQDVGEFVYLYKDPETANNMREMKKDKFYIINEDKKEASVYSHNIGKKFMDIQTTILIEVIIKDDVKEYIYYDIEAYNYNKTNRVYSYVVEGDVLKEVKTYESMGFLNTEPKGKIRTFIPKINEFDISAFDDDFINQYQMINE